MLNWIDADSEIKPQKERLLICYCPEWCSDEYQIARWNGKEFYYEGQPNDIFHSEVLKWSIFFEAD